MANPYHRSAGSPKDTGGEFAPAPRSGSKNLPKNVVVDAETLQRNKEKRIEAAKKNNKVISAEHQRYSEENNEAFMAKELGGVSLPDSEPVDVFIPATKQGLSSLQAKVKEREDLVSAHKSSGKKGSPKLPPMVTDVAPAFGVELKTIIDNKRGKISMKRDARARKAEWERKTGKAMSTVVLDDSQVFNANGPGQHDTSKRKIYYRRGFGNYSISQMYEVRDMKELKALLAMSDEELPQNARRLTPQGVAGKE